MTYLQTRLPISPNPILIIFPLPTDPFAINICTFHYGNIRAFTRQFLDAGRSSWLPRVKLRTIVGSAIRVDRGPMQDNACGQCIYNIHIYSCVRYERGDSSWKNCNGTRFNDNIIRFLLKIIIASQSRCNEHCDVHEES